MESIKVLIVEDDLKISEIHRRFTEKVEGFSVVGVANNMADAEEFIEVLEPELILLDVYFPDGNGLDLIWKIRARKRPIDLILITAAREIAPLQEALRGGAFDYLIKPVIIARFQETLARYRRQRLQFRNDRPLEQQDVDRLLNAPPGPSGSKPTLPKGVDAITLDKVRAIFPPQGAGPTLSAEEVGGLTGISRSTARRYLEYLVESDWLNADLVYGTVGRPERRYSRRS